MHSSKTWTTKDASIRTANAPQFTQFTRFTQFTQFHAQHIPNDPTGVRQGNIAPMPVQHDSIARVPLRRRKPT